MAMESSVSAGDDMGRISGSVGRTDRKKTMTLSGNLQTNSSLLPVDYKLKTNVGLDWEACQHQ